MQEKRKLKTKAIPAVDARPTKEGKQASTTLMSKRLPPAAGWALAGGLPKGPIGVEGKRGGESLFGWSLAWEFPVPLPAGSANCRGWSLMFPLVPTPPTSISQGESVPFRPPKVHTHTHTARSKPTLARPYGKRRRLNKTCRLVSVQGPGAVGGLVARRSVASTYTHGLVMDVAHSSHSQPARQTATSTAMGWGKWGGGRGKRGA